MGKVPKRCEDCKHQVMIINNSLMCDIIPGISCFGARMKLTLCSPKADWFEPKEDSE